MGKRKKAQRTRRTTLNLPAEALATAKGLARERGVSLSTVIGEALTAGLPVPPPAGRDQDIVAQLQRAFAGFTEEELAVLDGFDMKPPTRRHLPAGSRPETGPARRPFPPSRTSARKPA